MRFHCHFGFHTHYITYIYTASLRQCGAFSTEYSSLASQIAVTVLSAILYVVMLKQYHMSKTITIYYNSSINKKLIKLTLFTNCLLLFKFFVAQMKLVPIKATTELTVVINTLF